MVQIFKTYKLYLIQLVLLSSVFTIVTAQDVTVNAKLDTTEFLIGDQIGLVLEVKHPIKEFVGIPIFDQELTKQIEILSQSENDTSLLESGYYIIKKRILVTAFDSGYYALPPIPFLYHNDTIKSEPIIFKVNSLPVDTTQAIKDIKMPYNAPLSFAEVFPWAGGGIGLVLFILILIYIIRKIRRKEPIIKRFKPREPAHVIALRDLSKLKDNKLWQHDKVKEYYTVLTDIIRMYLWNRYAIRTMERTSDEILQSLKISDFKDDEAYSDLKDLFYVSDLVKFAKYKPIIDDHEKCMNEAYKFIDRTKQVIEEKNENTEEDKLKESKEIIKENTIN